MSVIMAGIKLATELDPLIHLQEGSASFHDSSPFPMRTNLTFKVKAELTARRTFSTILSRISSSSIRR